MANHLYNETQQNNLMQQFNVFQQNPMQFLLQHKINIPQQFQNNPHDAVQYLLNNGQMTQDGLNKLMQMATKMGIKI